MKEILSLGLNFGHSLNEKFERLDSRNQELERQWELITSYKVFILNLTLKAIFFNFLIFLKSYFLRVNANRTYQFLN